MCDDFGAGFPSGASLQLTTLDGITTGVLGAAQLALEHLEGGGEAAQVVVDTGRHCLCASQYWWRPLRAWRERELKSPFRIWRSQKLAKRSWEVGPSLVGKGPNPDVHRCGSG